MNKQSKTLKRTVILVSPPLTKSKIETLTRIYQVYGEILVEALEYMLRNNVTSWMKSKKLLYRLFREKYPDIPSHYIHEAIRDASQRLKSFKKLRKKGMAKTDKPVVRRWSVGCDSQLWKLTLEGARIATHRGWINIPLQFHKLFWRYYNGRWSLRSTARWRLAEDKLYLYVVFTGTVGTADAADSRRVCGVDINENNVTAYCYPDSKAVTIITNFSKVVLGYAHRRTRIQQRWSRQYGVRGNRRLRVALRKLGEGNVKMDIKLKLVGMVAGIVRGSIVVLERLPKRFQDRIVEKRNHLNGLDVHRLKQSSMRGIYELIIENLEKYNIPYILVNPRGTSSTCPVCGAKLVPMTGHAQRNGWRPRWMKCPRCGFTHDRDVIGAMNLARRYLLDVGPVPLAPKGAHDPHVEWLVATVNRGVEAQPVLARPTMT